MKERFIENGIEYIKVGDYYIPNLTVPQKRYSIRKYGNLHKKFIKEHHEVDRLIAEFAIKQGVAEQLKSTDQMKWVGMMNNIKVQAEEIVYSTVVYKREAL